MILSITLIRIYYVLEKYREFKIFTLKRGTLKRIYILMSKNNS